MLALTLIIFFIIQTFVAQPFQVEGGSMERFLEPGQFVLVDKLTPRFDPYKRGDVVVFEPPDGFGRSTKTPFIKRVVGLAGDSVQIHDGLVWINGTALDESYPYASTEGDPPDATDADPDEFAETVPDGDLFLMGDHRANSVDSRVFGSVPATAVVGRAWLRYWPFDVFTILPTPAYPKVAAPKS